MEAEYLAKGRENAFIKHSIPLGDAEQKNELFVSDSEREFFGGEAIFLWALLFMWLHDVLISYEFFVGLQIVQSASLIGTTALCHCRLSTNVFPGVIWGG